jgi:hypothetical protein
MGVLREYHAAMGALILQHEGTLERFTGDGIMIFLNVPVPVPDAPQRAVRMAQQMQQRTAVLAQGWKKRGHDLPLGIGIAMGCATIGGIGFEGRIDYGAIGNVTHLAARLCGEARGGEILLALRGRAGRRRARPAAGRRVSTERLRAAGAGHAGRMEAGMKLLRDLGRHSACVLLLAAAAPLPLRAATPRRVAWVSIDSPNPSNPSLKVRREAMREQGWIEGQNLVIDLWWAEGSAEKLKALLPQILARNPEVIVATTGRRCGPSTMRRWRRRGASPSAPTRCRERWSRAGRGRA